MHLLSDEISQVHCTSCWWDGPRKAGKAGSPGKVADLREGPCHEQEKQVSKDSNQEEFISRFLKDSFAPLRQDMKLGKRSHLPVVPFNYSRRNRWLSCK